MRIGEVAQQTGLTISNIRFYEKKGLISPEREKQNKYRDYTIEDVRQLKLILLYRKMNLSIETIGELAAGDLSMQAVLEQQILDLQREQQRLQESIDLCEKLTVDLQTGEAFLSAESADRGKLDIDRYLNYVKTKERTGHPFAEAEELLDNFAEFAQYDRIMLSSGLYAWLACHPRINRVLTVVWCCFWVLFPGFVLADAFLNEDGASAGAAVFFGMWLLFTVASFVQFWFVRKKNSN